MAGRWWILVVVLFAAACAAQDEEVRSLDANLGDAATTREKWGFGGLRTFGRFAVVRPRFEEREMDLGERAHLQEFLRVRRMNSTSSGSAPRGEAEERRMNLGETKEEEKLDKVEKAIEQLKQNEARRGQERGSEVDEIKTELAAAEKSLAAEKEAAQVKAMARMAAVEKMAHIAAMEKMKEQIEKLRASHASEAEIQAAEQAQELEAVKAELKLTQEKLMVTETKVKMMTEVTEKEAAECQLQNERLENHVKELEEKKTKKHGPETSNVPSPKTPPQEPVVKAPNLPTCSSGPKWGKCQPTAFFGYSDNWKRHRVCRDDDDGAVVICETEDCQSQAAQSSTLIKVDVEAGCLNDKRRMAEMPAPFCAYTQGLPSFGSVSVGFGQSEHTCATGFSGRNSVCFGADDDMQAARGLAATMGKGVQFRQFSAGELHTCGITNTLKLGCWGSDGDKACRKCSHQKVFSGIPGGAECTEVGRHYQKSSESCLSKEQWLQVSAARKHTCGITDTFKLGCWGHDYHKQVSGIPGACAALEPAPAPESRYTAPAPAPAPARGGKGQTALGELRESSDQHERAPAPAPPSCLTTDSADNTKWLQVSAGDRHTCGIIDTSPETSSSGIQLACWGDDSDKQVSGIPGKADCKSLGNSRLSVTSTSCLSKEGQTHHNVKSWLQVSAGSRHTCGITGTFKLGCWGDDGLKQISGMPIPPECTEDGRSCLSAYNAPDYLQVSAGYSNTCAITNLLQLQCWGDDGRYKLVSGIPGLEYTGLESDVCRDLHERGTLRSCQTTRSEEWLQVSVAKTHICAVSSKMKLACWGMNSQHQTSVPDDFFLTCHASCATCSGPLPTHCTSCPASLPHHTIVDPVKMAGTCTEKFCPLCKPKQCCGPNHKHFVMAAESMDGVCIRHTDQCQPLCIPHSTESGETPKARVCSKGCNQLTLIPNAPTKHFAVCQAQKQVKCEQAEGDEGDEKCQVEKEVEAKATCEYSTELWQAGGTCVIDVLTKKDGTNYACPPAVNPKIIEEIKAHCTLTDLGILTSELIENTATKSPTLHHFTKEEVLNLCAPIALAF